MFVGRIPGSFFGGVGGMILRPATSGDEDLFFQWRQDDEAGARWWEGERVEFANHLCWFRERVDNAVVGLWVAEHHGVPVGSARIDSSGEITVDVAKDHRGRGFGVEIIRNVSRQAIWRFGHQRVKAMVDDSNLAAMRAFEKAGYVDRRDVHYWRWRP